MEEVKAQDPVPPTAIQKPTVGRIVHVQVLKDEPPHAGVVTFVHNDSCINVATFDKFGAQVGRQELTQGNDVGQWNWPAR